MTDQDKKEFDFIVKQSIKVGIFIVGMLLAAAITYLILMP